MRRGRCLQAEEVPGRGGLGRERDSTEEWASVCAVQCVCVRACVCGLRAIQRGFGGQGLQKAMKNGRVLNVNCHRKLYEVRNMANLSLIITALCVCTSAGLVFGELRLSWTLGWQSKVLELELVGDLQRTACLRCCGPGVCVLHMHAQLHREVVGHGLFKHTVELEICTSVWGEWRATGVLPLEWLHSSLHEVCVCVWA